LKTLTIISLSLALGASISAAHPAADHHARAAHKRRHPAPAPSHTGGIDLGLAGPQNFAVLSLGGSFSLTDTIKRTDFQFSGVTITGNVGVAVAGSSNVSGSSTILSTLEINSAGHATFSGTADATGGVVQNAAADVFLKQAARDANNASATAAALPATNHTLTNINLSGSNLTINGLAGSNVLHLSNILMTSGSILTFNAPAGSNFVVDISRQFSLSSNSKILLAGGITPAHVLFNITGTGTDVRASGGSNVDGIVLAPRRSLEFGGGSVQGELIGGGVEVNISLGERVIGVPEPSIWSMISVGAALLVAIRRLFPRRA